MLRISKLASSPFAKGTCHAQAARDKAHGNPSKEFFVDMVTRDITLADCIFDLLDNSIDGAHRVIKREGTPISEASLERFSVSLRFDGRDFEVCIERASA